MAPLPWAVVRVDEDGLSRTSTMTQTFGNSRRTAAERCGYDGYDSKPLGIPGTWMVQGQVYRCPAGHVMEELVTHKAGYLRCDVCRAAQNVGRRMQGCWDCDYHVCCVCEKKFQDAEWYASWFKFWHGNKPTDVTNGEQTDTVETVDDDAANEPASQRQVVRCPGKHTLCMILPFEPPVQCDVCGKQLAPYVRIWGCSSCDYDIGPCCERKFEDPQFLESWQTFWCVSKEEPLEEGPPLPAPCDPPTVSSSSTAPEGPATVVTVDDEGPKVTRPKPVQIKGLQEELARTAAESSKAMVFGGKNEVVAPALMKAVLKKDPALEKTPRANDASSLDPAVLKFARKVKGTTKDVPSVSEETSASKDVSIVPEAVGEEEQEEKKTKKKKKEDKEKSEKSEKKEKKSKKEGKESRKDVDEEAEGSPEASRSRSTRRVKKSRHEAGAEG
eukprot:s375_g8.t5